MEGQDASDLKDRFIKKRRPIIAFFAIAILVPLVFVSAKIYISSQDAIAQLDKKEELLERQVFSNPDLEKKAAGKAQFVVFFSLCDTHRRAAVLEGRGKTLREAWDDAAGRAKRFVMINSYNPVWVKADVVNSLNEIKTLEFPRLTQTLYDNFFRKGISFDSSFNTALLEAELNGNKIIDYDNNKVDLGRLNKYLQEFNREPLAKVPDNLWLFTCRGYFCDESDSVYQLYDNDADYGRRKVDVVDKNVVRDLIYSSSQFLSNCVKPDGKFIYGYYPIYDKKLQDYNILRHTGAIWCLINQYKISGDRTLPPKIESTVNYLVTGAIDYPRNDLAYVVERKSDEVKLGGNAVAVVVLIDYMEEFGSDEYKDLVLKLGNGILALQNPATGKFYHVLNSEDLSRKEETRTVYYDGEAAFALAKLYSFTREEKYLTAACKAADYFIVNNYSIYRDHWIAYAMNEITKYVPQDRYYEFALKNAQDNLDIIYNQETSYHSYLELLMAAFATYDRIKQNHIQLPYLQKFDEKYFIRTIYKRARHQLNGFLYPEYAMYLKNPARIVNTFCVRHDGYRVRIDDIQHFIGGYYAYYNDYDKLEKYRRELGITG